jgi:GNAT superfamily N-acetyltransferase
MHIHTPDHRLTITAADGHASCALWWRTVPAYKRERLGLIGEYTATSAAAAHELLRLACARLADEGCTLAVGPLDGSTWARYRFVVEPGDEPPFFLEPRNPPDYPWQFCAAGFDTLASYTSALVPDLAQLPPFEYEVLKKLAARGITLRQVTPDDTSDAQQFRGLLRQVYPVVCAAFANNLLYQPISEAAFCTHYLPLQQVVWPELLWLAEHEKRVVGFLLALPDTERLHAGHPLDTIILKTLAVLPEYTQQGIGSLLCNLCQRYAAGQGFRRAIYALMHTSSHSQQISHQYAHPIRRYALFYMAVKSGMGQNL